MNISADRYIVSEASNADASQPHGIGNALHTRTGHRGRSGISTHDNRSDKADNSIHQTLVKQRSRQRSAAFDKQARDLTASELGQHRAEVDTAFIAGCDDPFCARRLDQICPRRHVPIRDEYQRPSGLSE